MSGFDISEHIILELLSQFAGKDFMLAMLCKRGTAFKIFGEMYRTGYASRSVGIVEFDARRVFGVSVPACLLVVDCSAGGVHMVQERIGIRSLEGDLLETAGYEGGRFFFSQGCHTFLDGECVFEWRQGIKHDCAAVCELEMRDGGYVNGLGEMADIEDELVYPLVKGGHIRDFREGEFRKYVLVTQKKVGDDTSWIRGRLPRTWKYLERYRAAFEGRKSSVYRRGPAYAMFGVGDYSYLQYKVVVSGFHKEPVFRVLSSSRPVMVDDTCYFLAFGDRTDALIACDVLNSQEMVRFLMSITDRTAKRPFTKKVLSRIGFGKFDYASLGYPQEAVSCFRARYGL